MSGVEILSLAANIFQVINLASGTIGLCNGIYNGRAPDEHLGEHASTLRSLSFQVQSHCQATTPSSAGERELERIARKCAVAARALEEEVEFATKHHAQGNLAATLRVAIKTLWRRNRLVRLEEALRQYQGRMESHLIFRVCNQSDAIKFLQDERFQKLDDSIQYFISQYAAGHTILSALVKSTARLTNEHTSKEARQVEVAVPSHVSNEVSSTEQTITRLLSTTADESTPAISEDLRHIRTQDLGERERQRFLGSLKFVTMNERRNHVTDSHEGTFVWIFEPDPALGATDTESQVDHDSGISDVSETEWESDSDGSRSSSVPSSLAPFRDEENADKPWDNFQEWLLSESDIYWISGKAGSGKSTLVKFLVTNDHTQAALNRWREGTVILSHFFWNPGNNMQKNLTGLFCTLLHQALSQVPTLLDGIVTQAKSYRDKDYDADWSVRELRALCMTTLASYPFPICIFLDGLDEICVGDTANLLDLVDDLRALPKVKICVASRPEAVFQKRLGHHPQMRVHDLTWGDMWAYARSILRARRRNSGRDEAAPRQKFPTLIIHDIVSKAEGVFLWLHLVTRSLLRGWEKGDDETELASRLEVLPSELPELYIHLWSRLNDDSVIYRKAAAELFHSVLTAASVDSREKEHSYYSVVFPYPLASKMDLLQFVALTTPSFQAKALDLSSNLEDDETIKTLGEEMKASIQRLGAGLLEVGRPLVGRRGFPSSAAERCRLSAVTFIHRSAHDFLTDSEKGHEILSFYEFQEETGYLRLALAELACSRYGSLQLGLISTRLRCIKSPALQPRIFDALHVAWRFYDAGYLSYKFPLHFLSAIAAQGFDDFALSTISEASRSSELATQVLRESFVLVEMNYDARVQEKLPGSFRQSLIRLGADPNSRGTRPRAHSDPRVSRIATQLTSYGRCVTLALDKISPGLRRLLRAFLQTGLAPEGRVPLIIKADRETPRLSCEYWFHEKDLYTASEDGPMDALRPWKLAFLLDASLPLLLEVVKRSRLGEQAPTINTEVRCRRPSATTSCSEDVLAPVVTIHGERNTAWAFRIVDKDTRAHVRSLVKSWLFADNESRLGLEDEMDRVADGISREISDNSKAYERVVERSRPIWDVLEEEGCCLGR